MRKYLSLLLLPATLAFGQTKEQIDGWMHSIGRTSNWPMFNQPDGCTSSPDHFIGVNFGWACNKHDACYRTPHGYMPANLERPGPAIINIQEYNMGLTGSNPRAACDQIFADDLAYRCKRDLRGIANLGLLVCLAQTTLYHNAVANTWSAVLAWNEGQTKAYEYTDFVYAHINDILAWIPPPPAPPPPPPINSSIIIIPPDLRISGLDFHL